jgi:hypothetical protein
MHGLFFGASQVLAEAPVTLLDEFPVDVDIIGRNDRLELWLAASMSTYSGQ